MACLRETSQKTNKFILSEVPSLIRFYSDGTIERLRDEPIVPPTLQPDPKTGVSSKDIFFSYDPPILARLYLPKTPNNNHKIPILVYFHGGSFCCESAFASHHQKYCNIVAAQGNVLIVSIEYRRPPECLLPTVYNDCWAGLQWVASQATRENLTNSDPWIINHGDFNKVFIGGDSAGGNIIHNIAMRAGVEALPNGVKVLGAYLNHPFFWGISNMPKPNNMSESEEKLYEETIEIVNKLWDFVFPGDPDGLDNPCVNPFSAKAPKLSRLGCSKMLITVASGDMNRHNAVLYYEAVKESEWRGEVQLFEEEDEDHVYHLFQLQSLKGKRLIKLVTDFLS